MGADEMDMQEFDKQAMGIAEQIGESDDVPVQQIRKVIEAKGLEFVQDIVRQTDDIEEQGGMTTQDGKRQRTKGGVFFYLVKGALDPDLRIKIFPNFGQGKKGAVLEWDQRVDFVTPLLETPGTARHIQVVVKGKHSDVKQLENSVVVTLRHIPAEAPYHRGIPIPNEEISTDYVIYMGIKQWEPIAAQFAKNPNDTLIVEGNLVFDPTLGSIAVFATQVTTKQLARIARKQANKAQTKSKGSPQTGKQSKSSRGASRMTSEPMPELQRVDTTGMSEGDIDTIRKLESANETFMKRIKAQEERGKASSTTMTRKMLDGNIQKIQAIVDRYTESEDTETLNDTASEASVS